jgi:hypothetical protein
LRILLIHGRNQQGKDPTVLRHQWLSALAAGCAAADIPAPPDADVAFPFYGDRLEQLTTTADTPLSAEIATRGGANVDPAYLAFRSQAARELQAAAGVGKEAVTAELTDEIRERGPQSWEWVQGIIRAIDRRYPAVTAAFIDQFLGDTWVYLTRPGARDEIDALVSGALTSEPTVVVGHSLGSVVGYSILRRHRWNVPRFVTLGSPLGITPIRNRFLPLRMPTGVADWFNAYDERDVVALRGLAATYPITPSIREDPDLVNETDNRHGIVGYLDDSSVAREVAG